MIENLQTEKQTSPTILVVPNQTDRETLEVPNETLPDILNLVDLPLDFLTESVTE